MKSRKKKLKKSTRKKSVFTEHGIVINETSKNSLSSTKLNLLFRTRLFLIESSVVSLEKGTLFIVPIKTRHAQLFLQLSRAWKYFNVDIPRISSARSYRESYIKKKTGQKQDRRLPTLYYSSLVNPTHCSKKFQTVNAERIEPQEKIKLLDQIVLT